MTKPDTKYMEPSVLCDWCGKRRDVDGAVFQDDGQWILCEVCQKAGITTDEVWAKVKPHHLTFHGISPRLIKMQERLDEVELYIYRFAYQAERRGIELDDAIQEGRLIALEALETYNPDMGASFATFVYKKLKHELPNRFVNDEMRTVRIPRWLHEDVFTPIDKFIDLKTQEDAREPNSLELIEDARLQEELQRRADIRWKNKKEKKSIPVITREKVREWVDLYKQQTEGFLVYLDDDEDGDPEEMIADRREEVNPEAMLFRAEASADIEEALKLLNPRHRRVLELRFGVHGGRTMTLRELGVEMELSQVRVMQIEREALEILRNHPTARRLLSSWG